MEADQNPEVQEASVETQVVEAESPAPEEPKSEEVNETPSPQNPSEPDEPPVEASKEEIESTEKESRVEETTEKTEIPPEPTEVPEDGAAKEVAEKPTAVEEKPQKVEEQVAEAVTPKKDPETNEKPADQSEQVVEPAKVDSPAVPAESKESSDEVKVVPAVEEKEKPAEATAVNDETPKAAQPKEPAIPMFFGWFLNSEVQERIKCSTMDFLKTLDTLEAFKKHIGEFTGEAEKEVDLEQYFQTKLPLHCTTKYCDYGKVEGSKEYANLQVVKDSLNSTTELSVVGLIVTPRTFGARLELTTEQKTLWSADQDKQRVPESMLPGVEALPSGSRAHVTLGCASGVDPFQTGLDLLEILLAKEGDKEAVAVEELELGTLSYLGQGRWYLALREAVTCEANFSSFSEDERPAEPAKKEAGEKKKKPKCSIL